MGLLRYPVSLSWVASSRTKLLENDVYWSVGAFLHISGRRDLPRGMYVDSMLDNTGFIVSSLRKTHVCKKSVSQYFTVLRVAKYLERLLDAYMLACRPTPLGADMTRVLTMCSRLNIERKRKSAIDDETIHNVDSFVLTLLGMKMSHRISFRAFEKKIVGFVLDLVDDDKKLQYDERKNGTLL
jgi:hypothetical protein